MAPGRIPARAFAVDVVAVLTFAALGRASHGEPVEFLGYLGTVAPFVVGLGAAWVTPLVRAEPTSFRAGTVVLVGTAVGGLLLRAAFTGRLPLTFALVTVLVLATFLLGWRALSMLVVRASANRATH